MNPLLNKEMPYGIQLAGRPYDRDGGGVARPPADAVGISAVRLLPGGRLRQYSAVDFDRGWAAVEHLIRMMRAVGFIEPAVSGQESYAVLDILNAEGDIIADYHLPHRAALAFLKMRHRLTVVHETDPR